MFSDFMMGTTTFNFSQVGVAYLLALEHANDLVISPTENIEYDR